MKRRCCKHVMCRTCMQHRKCMPCQRRERLCAAERLIQSYLSLPVSQTPPLCNDASTPQPLETQLSYPWKLHACRANYNYFLYILLYSFLSLFVAVFNCIIQNKSNCLHWQYFSILSVANIEKIVIWCLWHCHYLMPMANASNNSSFTGGVFYPSAR